MHSRHKYKVDCDRRVGPDMYYVDKFTKFFPYGKNKPFKTGELAKKAAHEYANKMCPLSSSVSVWKMNGYCGVGEYIKQSDERFDTSWDISVYKGE